MKVCSFIYASRNPLLRTLANALTAHRVPEVFEESLGIFDLKDATVCNSSTITGDDPVCITTSPQQWAYAAVFPLREDPKKPLKAEHIIIRVEATIVSGCIGVAVSQPDLREFICEEKFATPSQATFELTLRALPPGSWLVVRNAAAGGIVSQIQIHSMKAFLASESAGPVLPGDDAADVFDSPEALQINRARLEHLASLGLPLRGKSVLDVGCGVGHLSGFFADRGCRVTCIDAHPENLVRLESLYPGRETRVADVEVDSLAGLGHFDVVFCYGLIYHCENPVAALRNLASCCRELLLLETVVVDHPSPILQIVDEPLDKNQAVSGLGCRPSPAFIASALTRVGFSFVYTTKTQPDFPDFQFEWKGDCAWRRGGHLLRRVFIASRTQLENPHLTLVEVAPQEFAGEKKFRPVVTPKAVWVDVGAHLGEKTFSVAAQNPRMRVYAFEPNLTVASQLMGRLPNYVVLPMAVAEHDGCAPFYLNRYDEASSLLPFVPEGLKHWVDGDLLQIEATLNVPTVRLDTFLNQAGVAKVAYLKIDAQGSDLAVIRSLGERLFDIEKISLEVQTTPIPLYRDASRKEETVRLLTEAGFKLISCEKQSYDQEENLTFVSSGLRTSRSER